MEFSSDSDDELTNLMVRRSRNERKNGSLERFCSPLLIDLQDGTFMERRKGCIYFKSRCSYVHVSEAKRNPQKYFGDPTKKLFQRQVNTKQVLLLKVSLDECPNEWERVALTDADDCECFLFYNSTRDEDARIEQVGGKEKYLSHYPISIRLQYIESSGLRSLSCVLSKKKVVVVSEGKTDDVYTVDCPSDSMMRYCGTENYLAYSHLSINRMGESPSLLPENRYPIPIPSQRAIGVELLYPSLTSYDFNGIVCVGNKSLSITSATSDNAEDQLELKNCTQTALPVSMENWIWCASKEGWWKRSVKSPYIALASGQNVYHYFLNDSGEWRHNRVCRFRKTFVTSLDLYSRGSGAHPDIALCGMRNGSIQLRSLNAKFNESFDNVVRHGDSAITSLHSHHSKPYDIISCSDSGSVKLWDMRYLATSRNPVIEIRKENPHQQLMKSMTSSFNGFLTLKAASTLELYRTDYSVSLLNKVTVNGELDSLILTMISGLYYILYSQSSKVSFLNIEF